MNKYTSNGRKYVIAESCQDAAMVFAGRIARTRFGRWGYCRALQVSIWGSDLLWTEWSAFIGVVGSNPHETVGVDVKFTVYREIGC